MHPAFFFFRVRNCQHVINTSGLCYLSTCDIVVDVVIVAFLRNNRTILSSYIDVLVAVTLTITI